MRWLFTHMFLNRLKYFQRHFKLFFELFSRIFKIFFKLFSTVFSFFFSNFFFWIFQDVNKLFSKIFPTFSNFFPIFFSHFFSTFYPFFNFLHSQNNKFEKLKVSLSDIDITHMFPNQLYHFQESLKEKYQFPEAFLKGWQNLFCKGFSNIFLHN